MKHTLSCLFLAFFILLIPLSTAGLSPQATRTLERLRSKHVQTEKNESFQQLLQQTREKLQQQNYIKNTEQFLQQREPATQTKPTPPIVPKVEKKIGTSPIMLAESYDEVTPVTVIQRSNDNCKEYTKAKHDSNHSSWRTSVATNLGILLIVCFVCVVWSEIIDNIGISLAARGSAILILTALVFMIPLEYYIAGILLLVFSVAPEFLDAIFKLLFYAFIAYLFFAYIFPFLALYFAYMLIAGVATTLLAIKNRV
ncbi:MAG: hypothetical protein EOM80_07460 [Erysipelotrichia bacterium]|nr:hypothetical protein [Erysipelotrichia bacterium]